MEEKSHSKTQSHSLPKKYEASFVFEKCITQMWPLIIDIKNVERIIPESNLSTIIIDETNTSPFEYNLVEMSSLECSKKTSWLISKKNIPTQINASFSLVLSTLEDYTVFTICLILVNPKIDPSNYSKVVQNCKDLCALIIDNVDKMLKQEPVLQYEYESTEINCPIEVIWNFLITFDFLKVKCVKNLEINGELGKVGTNVTWNFVHENGVIEKAECRVVKANNNPKRKKWVFSIIALDGPSKNQLVKFTLLNLDNGVTFFTFFHKFNEEVGTEQLNHLKENKKKILKEIKKNLEDKMKKNLNTNESDITDTDNSKNKKQVNDLTCKDNIEVEK